MYTCKKSCNKSAIKSEPAKLESNWKAACIEPSNMNHNIYVYCQNTFLDDITLRNNCSLDSCRLCCAVQDQTMKGIDTPLSTLGDCNQACSNKFKIQ